MSAATMTVADVKRRFGEAINRVVYGKEHLRISRHGKVVAALISYEELKRFRRLLQEAEDREDAADARRALADDEFEDLDEVARQLAE